MSRIECLSDAEKIYLSDNKFIVADGIGLADEYNNYLNQLQATKQGNKDTLALTIGFTFACNFDCAYCIQKGNYLEHTHLNENNISLLYKKVLEFKLASGLEHLHINIFGGEPTLNLSAIKNL